MTNFELVQSASISAARAFARSRLYWLKNSNVNGRESITIKGSVRSSASVNHELEILSKIFNLAIDYRVTDTNPCTKVKKFALDNKRYRYLLPEEEPALMAVLSGPRAHLRLIVTVALGTGMRLGEQLRLTWDRETSHDAC